jgi:hypothetical protein
LIWSRRGRFLAIPTENAPRKGTDGRRIKPSTFPEHRFGPLRFVPRQSGLSLLVVDGLRASFSRQSGALRGFRRATDRARGRGDGLATVVMFVLVPQVKLRKRLDVARSAERCLGDRRAPDRGTHRGRSRRAGSRAEPERCPAKYFARIDLDQLWPAPATA